MKSVLTLLMAMLLLFGAARAETVEQYLAARDKAIAQVKAAEASGRNIALIDEQQERARGQLEQMLRAIIGPVDLKDLGAGKSNLETLSANDVGFGMLDGLMFTSADEKTRVLVTTEPLLRSWLKGHADWWHGLKNVPQNPAAALRSEPFYTQAISSDSAVSKYADLPLAKVTDGFATAMLVSRAQDVGPRPPDEVIVSAMRGGRVYVVSASAVAQVASPASCEQVWHDYERMAEAANTAYSAAKVKDEKLADRSDKLREAGDAAYRRCFNDAARKQDAFPALVKQAQSLLDGLPK